MYLANEKITDISQLRDRIWGEVVTPLDPGWDDARQTFNLAVDQQPAAIVYAESADDVAAAVRFARKNNLRVAPQTTGHNAGPLAPSLADVVLVKTTRMKGVEIDTDKRIARVQAGTVWGEVTARLEGTGLAALHGSSPTVGVVGYSLTGGVGFQARKHGLQTNKITAIELVNEFGEVIRASEKVHPDLFWALRGSGGNFGVVTAMEFELVPTPQVHAGMMIWPWEHAEAVYERWLEILPNLPEEFTTTCRLLQVPDIEEIPEFVRGRQLVVFNGAYLGDRDDAAKLLAPLRELTPEIDTFDDVDASALAFLHMDPEDPMPYSSDHMQLELLNPDFATEFVAAARPEGGSPLVMVELRHVGGALSRCAPGDGARSSLRGEMTYFAIAPDVPELPAEVVEAQKQRVRDVLEPHRAEQNYLNFSEAEGQLADFFDAHTFARIVAVKSEYDAADIFLGNFAV